MIESNEANRLQSLHLLYHELRPTDSRYSYVLHNEEFARHIDLISRIQSEAAQLRPEVTFDDGHISNFEYALPILQSRSVLARFFITVGWTGQKNGYMGWQQVRALHEAGHMIGAHGWTHTLLTHCTAKELHFELSGARQALEDKLGTPVTTMSLPGGRSNPRVLAACKEAGYIHIFTSFPKKEPFPLGSMIGRLNIRRDMEFSWISDLLNPESAVLARLEREYRVKTAAKSLLGDRIYAKIWGLLNREEAATTSEKAHEHEDSAHYQ